MLEQTFCSANGFYMLPINEPRNYRIRVYSSENLSFEPEFRTLNFADKNEQEIKRLIESTDPSFKFIGFAVKGQVYSQNANDSLGPKGVRLGLYDSKDKLLAEGLSEEGGAFNFQKLQAGSYFVQAIERGVQEYVLSKAEKRMKCEVSWGKVLSCQGRIVVSGYEYKGNIMNEDSPLQNFYMFLYELNGNHNPGYHCSKPEIPNHPLSHKFNKYLCYEVSGSDGGFNFPGLSHGDYVIAIKSIENDRKAEIEPSEVPVSLRHGALTQTLQFQVNRFSLQGKVVDTQGQGIPNVTISLDGEEKTKTDRDGFYSLERIKSGGYTLEGLHDHLFFEPIHDLKLSIGLKHIPSLVLTYLHICGRVYLNFENLFQESQDSPRYKITMYLEDAKSEKRTTFPDVSGHYCFEAKPGNYTVYPVIDKSLTDITFSPAKHSVEVSNKPKLNLDFHRPKVSIQGKVEFLAGLTKDVRERTKVKISCLGNQKALTYELSPTGDFVINNVLSGNYELSVENEGLCWEKNVIPLEINQNSNITGLKFKQGGWALRYEVSSEIQAEVTLPNGKVELWTFEPKEQHKCLKETGEYKITPNECSSYKESSFRYKTDLGEKLVLIPERHLISGELRFNIEKTPITKDLLERLPAALSELNYLSIESYSFDKSSLIEKVRVPFVYQNSPSLKNVLLFTYRHYVRPFTHNEIVPLTNASISLDIPMKSLLENLLFYPQKRESLISQTCQIKETDFTIKAGLILTGSITPQNLTEVTITIYQDNKPIDTLELTNGSFKVGPLSDAYEYRVEAQKANYKFSQNESLSNENVRTFKLIAQRLSMVKVAVLDNDRKPIPGVSVFISSTAKNEKLKLNNITDDKGLFVSNNLVKGEYMVKCSLKEYSFEPSQSTVKIMEGDHTEITFVGKQIAFSIYGRVLKLSQEGLENAVVEIHEDGKLKDSVKTNAQGAFRIRALEPFRHYQVMIRNQESLDYYKPQVIEIDMKNQDISDLEFIVFEKRNKYSIMGTIEFDDKYLKEEIEEFQSFEIEIFEFHDQQTALNDVRRLLVNRYFEFEELPMKEYVVKVSYKRTKSSMQQEISKIYNLKELGGHEFQLNKKIIIPKTVLENKKGQTQTFSLLAPVVLLVLLVSLLNLDATKEILAGVVGYLKKK